VPRAEEQCGIFNDRGDPFQAPLKLFWVAFLESSYAVHHLFGVGRGARESNQQPQRLVEEERFGLTPSGKLDRPALDSCRYIHTRGIAVEDALPRVPGEIQSPRVQAFVAEIG